MSIRVLYISLDGLTDPVGTSQILEYIVRAARKGVQYHVVTLEKEQRLEQYGEQVATRLQQAGIEWSYGIFKPGGGIKEYIREFAQLYKLSMKAARQLHPQVIHARALPSAMVGWQVRQRIPAKLLFDMRSFWSKERIERQIWNIKKPHYYLLYRLASSQEKKLMRAADTLIVLTNAAKCFIQNIYRIKNLIHVIPCAVDLTRFSLSAQKNQQSTHLKIGIVGTLYNNPQDYIHFFSILLRHHPQLADKITIVRIGSNTHTTTHLLATLKTLGLQTITTGSLPHEKMPFAYREVDVLLRLLVAGQNSIGASIITVNEALACGVPVILSDTQGDMPWWLSEEPAAGWLVNAHDERSIIRVGSALQNGLNEENRQAARRLAEKYLSLENSVEKLISIYNQLTE